MRNASRKYQVFGSEKTRQTAGTLERLVPPYHNPLPWMKGGPLSKAFGGASADLHTLGVEHVEADQGPRTGERGGDFRPLTLEV